MSPKLHARAQTTREHLIRSLWPLQKQSGFLKGWMEGRKLHARFSSKPGELRYGSTPWGGQALDFSGETAIAIAPSPLAGLATFTLEAWVRFDDVLAGPQVLLEHVGAKPAHPMWRLMLDRWGRLALIWMRRTPAARDRARYADWLTGGGGDVPMTHPIPPEDRMLLRSYHLVDAVVPGKWYHLAVINMEMDFLQICLTPEGQRSSHGRLALPGLFPRTVAISKPKGFSGSGAGPGTLMVGSSVECFRGSLCDLAVFPHAKRRNEFPVLGQRPPRRFRVVADYPLSSALLPVETGPFSVCVGCRPSPYQQKSFWFDARFENVKGKTLDIEILPWPGTLGMISSAWVSYDRRRWSRVRQAHFETEAPQRENAQFRHRFTQSPAWVAASVPYGLQEIDRLERDVRGARTVRVDVASHSTEGRPLRAFVCTDPSVPDRGKKVLYMQAGQHSPAEMLGGVALDAAVRRCARPGGFLRDLLRRAILVLVPVVNQDTAFHGCSSSVASGINLNRDWWEPRSAEVSGLKEYLRQIHEGATPILLAMDFHAGGWRAHTILCRSKEPNEQAFAGCHAIQERWLAALCRHADFNPRDIVRETKDHQDHPVNRGICTTAVRHQLHITAVVAELSTMVAWDRRRSRYAGLTQAAMQRMGADLLRTSAAFLQGQPE